jgi:hypothetical protein
VLGSSDFHRGNGGTFQRRKEDAAERISDRVSVAGLEGLGDKFAYVSVEDASSLTRVLGISKRP